MISIVPAISHPYSPPPPPPTHTSPARSPYVVKTGFARICIIVLISVQNIGCGHPYRFKVSVLTRAQHSCLEQK